jgi:hypothetical protein
MATFLEDIQYIIVIIIIITTTTSSSRSSSIDTYSFSLKTRAARE